MAQVLNRSASVVSSFPVINQSKPEVCKAASTNCFADCA